MARQPKTTNRIADADAPMVKIPMETGASATPLTIKAGIRQAIIALCGYAVGAGWVSSENGDILIAVLPALAASFWGLIETHTTKSKLSAAAADPRVPNSVLRLKS